MPHSETHHEVFTYFDDDEHASIVAWLEERNLEYDQPTLCGSCCQFWDEEFFVNLSPQQQLEFNQFAAGAEIGATAGPGGIRIADINESRQC